MSSPERDPLIDPKWIEDWPQEKFQKFWDLLARYKTAREALASGVNTKCALDTCAELAAEIRALYD